MYLDNVIKIQYSNMGYLSSYPYHLTCDKEMIEAFIGEDGFFDEYYPCPGAEFETAYNKLKDTIVLKLEDYLKNGTPIPDWIYSYMVMSAITYQSDEADIAYICDMANVDYDSALAQFNDDVARACLEVSTKWLAKQPSKYRDRPPTMFGEPHVVKSLRVDQANVLITPEGN